MGRDATPTPTPTRRRRRDSTIRRSDDSTRKHRPNATRGPSRRSRRVHSARPRRAEASSTIHDSSSVRPSVSPPRDVRPSPRVRAHRVLHRIYIYIYIGVYVFMYMSYVRVNKQNTRRPRAISRARSRASSSTFHPSNDPVDAFIRRRHQQRRSATHERANRTLYTRTVLNVGHHRSRRARTPRAHERGTTRRVRVHAAVDGGARVRGQATHRGACGRGDVEETRGRMS